jgi:ABC-type transport system substrate-binding protein
MLKMIKRRQSLLLGVLVAALIGLVACGSDESTVVVQTVIVPGDTITEKVVQTVLVEKEVQVPGETVVQTVVVEKQVAGDTVVQTVIVEKEVQVAVPGETVVQTVIVEKEVQVAQTVIVEKEIIPPGTIVPSGTLRVAIGEVSFPALIPSQAGLTSNTLQRNSSAYEPLVYMNVDGFLVPRLAQAWTLSGDGLTYTVQLKKGVQFHGGWGEMTAHDWKYSFDDGVYNPETNRTNIHIPQATNAQLVVLDNYTFEYRLEKPDPLFFFRALFLGYQVYSEQRFRDLGPDEALDKLPDGGTGPFEITKWIAETEMVVEAIPNHHFQTPYFQTVHYFQLTENATILAALKSGQIDVAPIAINFQQEVLDAGLLTPSMGEGEFMMEIAGNQCMTGQEWPDGSGEIFGPRNSFDPALPWIGDCVDGSVASVNAAKVRLALNLAIDRQGLVEGVVDGRGRPLEFFDASGQPYTDFLRRVNRTKESFEFTFDLVEAKRLLTEAGWPDGFEFENVCVTGRHPLGVPLCEAVANQWEAAGLGLKPQNTRQIYRGGIRDRLVAREFAGIWSQAEGVSTGLFYPLGDAARRPNAAFNPGSEFRYPLDLNSRALAASSLKEVDAILLEYLEWQRKNIYSFGVIGFEDVFALNPKVIGTWERSANLNSSEGDMEFAQHAK